MTVNRSQLSIVGNLAVAHLLGLAVWLSPASVRAQNEADQVPAPLAQDPVFRIWEQNPAVSACGRCHYEVGTFGTPDRSFSRQGELKFWLGNDKHSIARRRVEPLTKEQVIDEAGQLARSFGLQEIPTDWLGPSNVLSRRICDKLNYNVETADGYALFRDNCLTCHGGYRDSNDDVHFTRSASSQPGISCNYCHQIGQNTQWVNAHGTPGAETNWRPLPPEQKAEAGMRDLVSTSTQADLCFDCHVGNRTKNMFVTHEMYAAGHPPIPSIELETFCREMPQHWQSPSQLYDSLAAYPGRDQYYQTNYPGVTRTVKGDGIFWNTRKMLIGALTARRKAIDLFVDSAGPQHQWADYSLYDCAACHHELESFSRRQLRGYPGAPGRPRQHEWPDALLNILYEESNLAASGQIEQELLRQFSQRPFGDPAQIGPTAQRLRDQIDAAIQDLETKPVTAAVAMRLLTKLARTSSDRLLTYDSARQVVWAMNTIVEEMEAEDAPLNPQVANLVRSLGDSTVTGIEAKLPSGRQQFIFGPSLAADLQRRQEYNPDRLKAKLDQIQQLLAMRPRDASRLVRQREK